MTKKNFEAKLGATVKAQDAAVIERFDDANSLLAKLPKPGPSAHKPYPAQSKVHVVRATFSMAASDYDVIELLRTAAAKEGVISTASEVFRAAIHAVAEYDGPAIVQAIRKLHRLRPGQKE
jgi:hypothetical protein